MAALPQNPAPSAPLPEPLTLPALQRYVARIVAERGFTGELDRVFILLVEELGELAEELAARAAERVADAGGPNQAAARLPASGGLAFELADVTLYLADLANGLGVDLGAALAGTAERSAAAAGQAVPAPRFPERASLCEWQAWAAQSRRDAGAAWLDLIEATGRLARHLRRRWSGKTGNEAAALGDALRAALSLAGAHSVDLGAALREKEQINRGRTWTE